MTLALDDIVAEEQIEAVRKPLSEASLLPPKVYSHESVFDLERQTIFAHEWLPVCHVSQLPEAGSYIGRTVGDEPVLVLRDKQNAVQVFSNVCRHRNMALKQGAGKCNGRISCPYHGWTYGLDGRLLAAPFMDETAGFNRADYSLPKIRFEVWHGFVFVNLDETAPSLNESLSGLTKYIDGFDFANRVAVPLAEIDAPWNWKLSLENFSEAYHQPWVHTNTAEPSAPATGARYYDNEGGPWSAFLIPHAEHLPGEDEPQIERSAPPRSIEEGALVFNIYPYFHVLATTRMGLWLNFEIDAVGHHRLIWHVMFRKEDVAAGEDIAIERIRAFIGPVIDEDIGICTGVGQGVHARLARPGRLSYMERAVHQFHNWWLDGLRRDRVAAVE